MRCCVLLIVGMALALALALAQAANAAPLSAAPFTVVAKIDLANARGRVDHLAFDARHRRLFVAEIGSNAVAVIDVGGKRFERQLAGIDSPQGIAYLPGLDRLLVTSRGDGMLRAYDAVKFELVMSRKLG